MSENYSNLSRKFGQKRRKNEDDCICRGCGCGVPLSLAERSLETGKFVRKRSIIIREFCLSGANLNRDKEKPH